MLRGLLVRAVMAVLFGLTGVLGALAVLFALPGNASAQCEPPAHRGLRVQTFPATITVLESPLLKAELIGTSGEGSGRIIWQPIPAPPPAISDGCKENTRFTVENFTGALVVTNLTATPVTIGPIVFPPRVPVVVLAATQPVNASLLVHFGPATEPNKPLLTFHSDEPVVFLPGTPAEARVQFVHLLGGEVNQIKVR